MASHRSQHVGRHSLVLCCHKGSSHGCFSRPCAQWAAVSAYTPLAAQGYVLCKHGVSSSICQAVAGVT